MWKKEILISIHCNTSFIHSNSIFHQQLLKLTAMGGKALALWYFNSKSYSLLLHAALTEIRPEAGPTLHTKRLSA